MFENRSIGGIYMTRFIASWLRKGGSLRYYDDYDNFHKWLLSLGLSERDADDIVFLAMNGKMELEESARRFLSNLQN